MKKLLLLLLVFSFTTFGNQYTVSAGYGISSSATASGSLDSGGVGNALNLNAKYLVGSSLNDISYGPYIDYVGASDWGGDESFSVSSSILSYGIFAKYKHPENGYYFSGSIGLSSPSVDDGDFLTTLEQMYLALGADSASFNSSIDGGFSYILTAGYELQDNFAIEANYKVNSASYVVVGTVTSFGTTQTANLISGEISFSTITVGASYTF